MTRQQIGDNMYFTYVPSEKFKTSFLSAQLAALEMIHSGTTGFIDAGGKYADVFAQVYEASGLRGRLTCFTNDNAPEPLRCGTVEEGVRRLRELRTAKKTKGE